MLDHTANLLLLSASKTSSGSMLFTLILKWAKELSGSESKCICYRASHTFPLDMVTVISLQIDLYIQCHINQISMQNGKD